MPDRVPGVGPKDAKIMLVGEGPGKQELSRGEPFVGKSGKEIDTILKTEGLSRDALYITNATKTKKRTFFSGGEPTKWFEEGIAELRAEIHEVDPDVIIAVGKQAMYACTGRKLSIQKYRGSPLPSVHNSAWVIPMLHPAFIFRGMWHKRPMMYWDVRKAKRIAEEGGPRRPDRKFTVFPNEVEIRSAIERLTAADEFVADTEWYSPDILSCIGFSDDPEWAICIPADHPSAREAYEEILSSDAKKIFQNMMFDVPILSRAGIDVKYRGDEGERLVEDTMVGFFYCWPDLGTKKLQDQVSIYTDEEYYKDDLEFSHQTNDPELEYLYNCKDNAYTYDCWKGINEDFDWMNTRGAYENNMMNSDIMLSSAIRGIRIDREVFDALREEDIKTRDAQQAFLNKALGRDVNVKSPEQIKTLVYDVLKLKVPRGRRKNTQQDTLMDVMFNTDNEDARILIALIVGIRHRRTRLERYYNPDNIDPDGRMRFVWDLCGTKNGRYSAKKTWWGSGLPIQQIPYQARQMFVPDEGYVFIKPDYDQAEARVVAHLTDDLKLLDWMREGADIHRKLAEEMFGVPYESMGKEDPQRYVAKQCRHALNYRMGTGTFRFTVNKRYIESGIGISPEEAEKYRTQYLSIHPNLEFWWKRVEKELRDRGWLENPFGRRRMFYQSWGTTLVNDAIAFYPQSTIADLTHHAIRRINDMIPYTEVFVNMHDGALVQTPEDRVDETLEIMEEALAIPFRVRDEMITIPHSIDVGMSWGG